MKLPSFSPQAWILLVFSSSRLLIGVLDTRVIWGLNLGQYNLTAAFLEAKALVKAFESPSIKYAGIVLEAIEIGNEADLYSNNGARPRTFTSTQYVTECAHLSIFLTVRKNIWFFTTWCCPPRWIEFATNVSALAQQSSFNFWGGSFAESSHSTSGFSPQAIFEEGILSSTPGSLISTYAYAYFL